MKKTLSMALLVTASSLATAEPIKLAEELASSHTSMQAFEIGSTFGINGFHGPYDGEIPAIPCSYSQQDGCVNYSEIDHSQEFQSAYTNQAVENFIYYTAYRNVMAGFAMAPELAVFKSWVEQYDLANFIRAEVYLLKTHEKQITLMSYSTMHQNILNAVKEAY